MAVNYAELLWLASAEVLVVITALTVLGVDLKLRTSMSLEGRRSVALGLGALGCLVGMVWLLGMAPNGTAPGGMLASDPLTRLVKVILLGLTASTLGLSVRSTFTPHVGEYVAVVLLGGVGMMLIAGSENVLMMFLALELASLSLYILAGFAKRDPRSMEAALKYFLFGGMAAAFLLFGLSLVYGVTGAIEFRRIAAALAGQPVTPLLLAGLVMVLVGLGFKVAAVPFHFWAPDAYEGAPTPAAGFIAAGSKVASFFIVAKFALVAFASVGGSANWDAFAPGLKPLVALVAAASMVVGNFAALAQTNVKRLLAYSAVAHAGYTLVAVVAGGNESLASTTFYAATYAVTAVGAFGVIGLVELATGGSDFRHFAGLSKRSPALAIGLGVFVLSLAGIPPLAGFFSKFYVFAGAMKVAAAGGQPGLLWLVGLGAATTCISFYYYLRILKAVFVEEPSGPSPRSVAGGVESWTVMVSAVVVVVVGCLPALLLGPLRGALVAAGF